MRSILIIILLILAFAITANAAERYELPCDGDLLACSRQVLIDQVGVREATGNNDGPQIAKYLRSVGIYTQAPYCAAGQYYCFYNCLKPKPKTQNPKPILIPIPRSGVANKSYDYAKQNGTKTEYRQKINDLIVWRKRGGWTGHVERVFELGRAGWVRTIGFNTSNGRQGSQREGNGVFIRNRNIFHPIGRLVIRGLVGFKEIYNDIRRTQQSNCRFHYKRMLAYSPI